MSYPVGTPPQRGLFGWVRDVGEWGHEWSKDGRLAVGRAFFQDAYLGKKGLRVGQNPDKREPGEGGTGGPGRQHAAGNQ